MTMTDYVSIYYFRYDLKMATIVKSLYSSSCMQLKLVDYLL